MAVLERCVRTRNVYFTGAARRAPPQTLKKRFFRMMRRRRTQLAAHRLSFFCEPTHGRE
jgi:hypothetical protein